MGVKEGLIIRKRIQKEQALVEADFWKGRVSIVAGPEVELHPADSS